jgi:hypothetical protein
MLLLAKDLADLWQIYVGLEQRLYWTCLKSEWYYSLPARVNMF